VRVLIDYRPALRQRSGVGEYTHELARALLAEFPPGDPSRALELTLFSSSWKDRFASSSDLAGAARIDRRVPVSVLNLAWHRLDWPPIETLSGRSFDVAHSSHPLLMPARSAAQVITIHDLDFLTHPERTRAEIRRDYPELVGDHARRADAVIVSSAFTAGEVERALGVARERIAVCPHGAPDWQPRSSAPANGYLLFFGTLEPRKNVGGLLDAYERLISDDADRGPAEAGHDRDRCDRVPELILAGRATDAARPWLERIARAPLAGRVRHVGYVEPDQRRDLYAGARMLIQPSFEEGFGITVLEAMSLGVPVVAARRGSLPEVTGDAADLVDPESSEDIARGVQRLLCDAAYAAECAAKGLARAGAFRWKTTARRVYETYQHAVVRRAQRAGAA
jgi:glycosyltransferase involved in cell wall biosynthesis